MAKKNKVGKRGKQNRNAGKHPSYKKRKMTPAQIKKKRERDKKYNKRTVADRVERNRKRREQRKKGNKKAKVGSKYDYDHATGRMVHRKKNRGRNSKNGGTPGDRRARG